MKSTLSRALRCNRILLAGACLSFAAPQALTQESPPPEPKVGPKGGTPLAKTPTAEAAARAAAAEASAQSQPRMSQMKSQTASAAMKPDKLSDDALKSAVIAEIKKNTAVDVSTIQVEAKDGTVTLSGTAKSSTEKYAAGRSAMAVKGATIKNEIVVGPAAATRSP